MAAERIDAELAHHVREVDSDVVVDDLAVHDLPEVHVADLDALARRGDAHELARMGRLLAAERGHPFPFRQTRLVDADLVGERRLEGALPVRLELGEAPLRAAAGVAVPGEATREKLADVIDPVVVEAVDHALDEPPRRFRLGPVVVLGEHGLLWAGAFHGQPFTAPAVSPDTICRWNTITRRKRGAVIETAAATARTWSVVVVSMLKKLAIAGTIVWF